MRASPLALAVGALLFAPAAFASFHFMQIEQVIGGVNGNAAQQAIQLRMRSQFQNQLQNAQLVVRDAAGNNPVVLAVPTTTVPASASGSRVLIATPAFVSGVGLTADFVLANPIPSAYFTAGKLTFEDDFGTVYWSLAWGGAMYTGTNVGVPTPGGNDSDGQFSPAFAGPLPTISSQSLLFPGASSALSTNNTADYQLTAGSATFTNNAGQSATVPTPPPILFRDGFEDP